MAICQDFSSLRAELGLLDHALWKTGSSLATTSLASAAGRRYVRLRKVVFPQGHPFGSRSMLSVLLSLSVLAMPQAAMPMPGASDTDRFIDLAKSPLYREKEAWVGKSIETVLPASSLSRLILLTAVTAATADLDVANIRRLLSSGLQFEHPAKDWDSSPLIWEAVAETNDGHVYLLRVYRAWAQLISPEAHGFFRIP
ncbi:MAG: hypothetical protein ABIW82_00460 [Dokdonella sp.]